MCSENGNSKITVSLFVKLKSEVVTIKLVYRSFVLIVSVKQKYAVLFLTQNVQIKFIINKKL